MGPERSPSVLESRVLPGSPSLVHSPRRKGLTAAWGDEGCLSRYWAKVPGLCDRECRVERRGPFSVLTLLGLGTRAQLALAPHRLLWVVGDAYSYVTSADIMHERNGAYSRAHTHTFFSVLQISLLFSHSRYAPAWRRYIYAGLKVHADEDGMRKTMWVRVTVGVSYYV